MGEKALIVKGDKTSHGGTVLEGFEDYTIQGKPVAAKGHKVKCPKCKGVYPIVQGYDGLIVDGKPVALEGFKTACGAKLIASQHEEVVDDGGYDDALEKEASPSIPANPETVSKPQEPSLRNFVTELFRDENNNIRFRFTDHLNRPYANTDYTAYYPDGTSVSGTTDSQGYTDKYSSEYEDILRVHLALQDDNADGEEISI